VWFAHVADVLPVARAITAAAASDADARTAWNEWMKPLMTGIGLNWPIDS